MFLNFQSHFVHIKKKGSRGEVEGWWDGKRGAATVSMLEVGTKFPTSVYPGLPLEHAKVRFCFEKSSSDVEAIWGNILSAKVL